MTGRGGGQGRGGVGGAGGVGRGRLRGCVVDVSTIVQGLAGRVLGSKDGGVETSGS